ncbi:hypothetical protein [Sinorhizobium fredii]|uniref:hypothetical protein n=1 Tax=Rhizobium fredii TaxID=380 RepID=UPI003399C520
MQPRFMSTEAFLRFEKEWQHLRRAVHKLEIEANAWTSKRSTAWPAPNLRTHPWAGLNLRNLLK